MAELSHTLITVAHRLGPLLLAPIFLANALGAMDQSVAVRELAATGVGEPVARAMVGLGRALQLVATPCLFVHATRPIAALLMAIFLVGATCTAHALWKAAPADRDRQLANFLKNAALVGGLPLAAAWSA